MKIIFEILLMLFLVVVVYEDFRHRAISWFLIPLLFGACMVISIMTQGLTGCLRDFLINISFLIIQLILVKIWFSIKHRKLINVFRDYIGIGDILFLVSVAPLFFPLNFISYMTLSLLVTLIVFGIYGLANHDMKYKIPLAGVLAGILLLLNGLFLLTGKTGYYRDEVITDFIFFHQDAG